MHIHVHVHVHLYVYIHVYIHVHGCIPGVFYGGLSVPLLQSPLVLSAHLPHVGVGVSHGEDCHERVVEGNSQLLNSVLHKACELGPAHIYNVWMYIYMYMAKKLIPST